MTGFVLLRARAHHLLLAAALLTVLLTTAVLATLTAYSAAIGDASLRHALRDPGNTADSALVVRADLPADQRAAADTAVLEGARRVFDGFPVTVRTLARSGSYALPRSLRAPAARGGDPDLTHFAALDRSQVEISAGRLPAPAAGPGSSPIEVALPASAAERLRVGPGARLTLVDRLGGPRRTVRVTGLYRPVRPDAPYWRLDELGGRGVKKVDFTTYGPLLTDPAVLTGGRVSVGESAWQASADFSALSPDGIGALRDAARAGQSALRKDPALSGATAVTTSLPEILDGVERSLLVSRSTLLIVALQLALLAGYALLLVARLLSAERAGETRVLRARGASRRRIAGLAALEALLLAVPAAVCAPLVAGPLTRLLAGQGALARIGLRLDVSQGRGGVWLVGAGVALGCALAVTLPALTSGDRPPERARSLPAPVRAGADVGLLVIAAVAYWRLDRQTSGALTGGAPAGSDDTTGSGLRSLGVDPLLVAAPALALLAGTVLTLRLLPPVARLAERRAASGRGLPAALAGWQLSRRPMRGAGPVLLLVLAVAMGMLAIGEGASWNRSQDDQADFRAGTPVRVTAGDDAGPGDAAAFGALPGVSDAAPVVRTTLPLSGGRTAAVLALDTRHAAGGMLLRADLSDRPVEPLLKRLTPKTSTEGVALPTGSARLGLTMRLRGADQRTEVDVSATLADRFGTPYTERIGQLPSDGRPHALSLDLAAGPLTLTGVELDMPQPVDTAQRHRVDITGLSVVDGGGARRRLALPAGWKADSGTTGTASAPDRSARATPPKLAMSAGVLSVRYGTGYVPADLAWQVTSLTVRLHPDRPAPEVAAIATDRFLKASGTREGRQLDVPLAGATVRVTIVDTVRALPTTSEAAGGDGAGGALLVDLRAVNRALQTHEGQGVTPTEWWLDSAPGDAAKAATALRRLPGVDPSQVVVRDEVAGRLRDDPFGAGPEAAFAAAALVAAALAAVGFAVSTAGSLRERGEEFAVLRALGAPRRQLARLIAAEQGVLVGLALVVGAALGTVLTRAVVPLIVLTSEATRPVPWVLVRLPLAHIAVLLAGVAVAPLASTAFMALRRPDAARSLRRQGGG